MIRSEVILIKRMIKSLSYTEYCQLTAKLKKTAASIITNIAKFFFNVFTEIFPQIATRIAEASNVNRVASQFFITKKTDPLEMIIINTAKYSVKLLSLNLSFTK